MTTKNKILTSTVPNVLFIPIEAIFNNDSVPFVYKKDGGSVTKQQVIVGQSNENEIIIKAGLEPDEEVMLAPPENADKLNLRTLPKEIVEKFKVKPGPDTAKKPAGEPSSKEKASTGILKK